MLNTRSELIGLQSREAEAGFVVGIRKFTTQKNLNVTQHRNMGYFDLIVE